MYALNLPQEELEDLCIRQLKSGEPVWFACDAGAYGARKEGVWDQESVQYEKLLGDFSVGLPKGIGLEYHDTAATHAVLLTGVNLDVSGYPGGKRRGTMVILSAQRPISGNMVMKRLFIKSISAKNSWPC